MSKSKEWFQAKSECTAAADTPIGMMTAIGRAGIAVFLCPSCRETHMNIKCGPVTMMLDLKADVAVHLGEALITPPAMTRETYEKENHGSRDDD